MKWYFKPMATSREPPELMGEAPAFLDTLAHVSAAAGFDRPLLITGERGSGKELIAGRIHFLSPRWEGPFVKVNCAALNEELLESELFGHEAGAFTGAQKKHTGRFERAEGGTLFLDEISSASMRVQEKLLRVIEYGEYERVGGEQTLIADVRVVAAANIDLRDAATKGQFRADLLDRLTFDVIANPPLRARKEDIPLLATYFGAAMAREASAPFAGFAKNAMAAFIAHEWPGNVRELKNAAERSVYRWLSEDNTGPIETVIIDPFQTEYAPPKPLSDITTSAKEIDQQETPSLNTPLDLRKHLDAIEKKLAQEALALNHGNQKKTATHLGLTYDQMRGLVRKYDLS